MDENQKEFSKIITNSIENKNNNYETIKIYFSDENSIKFKKLKTQVELNNEILINFAISYLFNSEENKNFEVILKEIKNEYNRSETQLKNTNYKGISISLSAKNESRIGDLLKENPNIIEFITSKGILLLYKKLIDNDLNE